MDRGKIIPKRGTNIAIQLSPHLCDGNISCTGCIFVESADENDAPLVTFISMAVCIPPKKNKTRQEFTTGAPLSRSPLLATGLESLHPAWTSWWRTGSICNLYHDIH